MSGCVASTAVRAWEEGRDEPAVQVGAPQEAGETVPGLRSYSMNASLETCLSRSDTACRRLSCLPQAHLSR